MKKILVAIPSFRIGGAERFMINLINNLDDLKFEKALLVIDGEGPYQNLVKDNVKVFDLKQKRVSKSRKDIINVVNEFEPNFIITTLVHLNLTMLSLSKKFKSKPKIFVREATNIMRFFGSGNFMKKTAYKVGINLLYKRAEKVILQCNDMRANFAIDFNIAQDKLVTIYNPVDVDYIIKKSEEQIGDIFIDENHLNLISVGRLSNEKDYPTLIQAIKILKEQNYLPNIKLNIIGDGPNKGSLQELIEKLNLAKDVNLVGFKDNPYKYIRRSHIFVLSSKIEGFPNVLLEALVCGIKVVSTDCETGPKEILLNNKYGHLCEVGNPKVLAETIIKSYNHANISGNRYKDFSISKIIDEYEKIFRD